MEEIYNRIRSTMFLTDGGLETDLIFNHNINLPHFAAFPLVENPLHKDTLLKYYVDYLEIAKQKKTGFILESATWRANKDWGFKLGYTPEDLKRVNTIAIEQLKTLKDIYSKDIRNIFVSGCIGPRGDGYQTENVMSAQEAQLYHNIQIATLKSVKADVVTALTMNYKDEALGIVQAAQENEISVVISFTVETNGHLPSGESLQEVIEAIDAKTDSYPLYYMINCAHPSHFFDQINGPHKWKSRIRGIRANASCKSHEELDESTELDPGDITDLSNWHKKLKSQLPELTVYGGCCGTDASHIKSICNHVLAHTS